MNIDNGRSEMDVRVRSDDNPFVVSYNDKEDRYILQQCDCRKSVKGAFEMVKR